MKICAIGGRKFTVSPFRWSTVNCCIVALLSLLLHLAKFEKLLFHFLKFSRDFRGNPKHHGQCFLSESIFIYLLIQAVTLLKSLFTLFLCTAFLKYLLETETPNLWFSTGKLGLSFRIMILRFPQLLHLPLSKSKAISVFFLSFSSLEYLKFCINPVSLNN